MFKIKNNYTTSTGGIVNIERKPDINKNEGIKFNLQGKWYFENGD